jgi:hypothetical protein
MGALSVLLLGGLFALRRWPAWVVPRLPPSLAMAGWWIATSVGRDVIGDRLRDPDAESLVLARLNGSRDERLAMCARLARHTLCDLGWSERISGRLYDLANDAHRQTRSAARALIRPDALGWLAAQVDGKRWALPTQAIAPDGWVPGIEACKALAMQAYLGAGFDHRMPSRHTQRVRSLLDDLSAAQSEKGAFAQDARDHALVTAAIAELYAMSHDPDLRPRLESAQGIMRTAWPPDEPRWLWASDTTLAMVQLGAWTSPAHGDGAEGGGVEILREGFQRAFDPTIQASPSWHANGKVIAAPPWMAAGCVAYAGFRLGSDSWSAAMPKAALVPGSDAATPLSTMPGIWWEFGMFERGRDWDALVAPRLAVVRDAQVYAWGSPDDGSWDAPTDGDRLVRTCLAIIAQQCRP